MSLILDALRKSEAERKRGQAPGLFSPMPMPPSRRRRTPVWPMVVGAIGLILLAAIAIRYWPGDATREESSAAPAVEPPAMPVQVAAPSTKASAPAPAPAQVAPAVPPPSTSAPVAAQPSPAPVVAAPLPAPTLPAPAPATPEPANDTLPGLALLPPDQRANLPPLKLSMHVWSEQPARRIAIIDGQRVSEGSSLSGAIVAEIRRDGVALDINGQRYLLPRP